MHASSYENMRTCVRRYVRPAEPGVKRRILDLGGADVNGSYAELFPASEFEYTGADIAPSPGVSMVLTDPYVIPLPDNSVDFVLSGQMLEHCEYFWRTFAEMVRVLKPDGYIFLIAPSAGPIHNYPVDCYRYYPDSYRALAKLTGCHLIDVWLDERGPWRDLTGVFAKSPQEARQTPVGELGPVSSVNRYDPSRECAFDLVKGEVPYLDVLQRLHRELQPGGYFEIGVRHGRSLALASCPAVGVDPDPDIQVALPDSVRVEKIASDDFFAQGTDPVLTSQPDLVFIDGMHLFEFALRDFMNVERMSGPGTVVVIDDVCPNLAQQATRDRETRVWTGDVWKLYDCLKRYRPDLQLTLLDTAPSGLLMVAGLDPNSRVLWDRYNPIVREYVMQPVEVTEHILSRADAISPQGALFTAILQTYSQARQQGMDLRACHSAIEGLRHRAPLKLSVIVTAFNMARELPRTLKTLSASMQRGIYEHDYEVIVVDNGSSVPFDRELCRQMCPNVRFMDYPPGRVSPVMAINEALSAAQGQVIGVFIDGARMASPGLLSAALDGVTAQNHVVGTLSFHLGHEVQMLSVQKGYDQAAEDALLAQAGWEADAYRLFDISVPGGSSAEGWLSLPAETNAVFMDRAMWAQLGGFDPAFVSPGGGLANLDLWARACHAPGAEVVMLLGEATFHQVHGGVATNAPVSRWDEFNREYAAIRGHGFERPRVPFTLKVAPGVAERPAVQRWMMPVQPANLMDS